MGGYAEQFKSTGMQETISKLREKYEQQNVNMKEDEILGILRQEKEQEKDDNVRGNYDMLIRAVKEFFAKKFNEAKAKQTILQKSKDEILAKKALDVLSAQPQLEQFSKQVLGKQFVENLKKSNAYVKQQAESSYIRSL